MKIQNGSIIPGISISGIKLGITKKEILKIIEGNYQEEILKRGSIIIIENAKMIGNPHGLS